MALDKYMFVAGYNNSGSLAVLTLQPTAPCPGIVYGVETYAGSGRLYKDNPAGALNYKPGISPDDYNTVVDDLGLDEDSGIFSIEGTLRYRVNDNSFKNLNVLISYPPTRDVQRLLGRWAGVSFPFVSFGEAN
jgi:hypothetical protein